jgi:hypothetical protein
VIGFTQLEAPISALGTCVDEQVNIGAPLPGQNFPGGQISQT